MAMSGPHRGRALQRRRAKEILSGRSGSRQARARGLEPLEDRRLLALVNHLPQYQDPRTGEFSADWDPKRSDYPSIDGPLLQAALEHRYRIVTDDTAFTPSDPELTVIGDMVMVDAYSKAEGGRLEADIAKLGGQVTASAGAIVSALVPLSKMERFAQLGTLGWATPAYRPVTNAGLVQSQGDAAVLADLARALGVDGTGIDVGIISDSFNQLGGYATDQANGEFPTPVTIRNELPVVLGTGFDEGRALAQIIADVAPGARSIFHTGVLGIGNFVAAVNNLRNAGADIIVDDVLYLSEPMFQDGAIAQAISDAVAGGVAHFSSAGNYGEVGAEFGAFVDSGDVGINGGPLHDFDPGPGVDIYQKFSLPVGQSMRISFQWDEPFLAGDGRPGALSPGSASDVDVLIVDKTGTTAFAAGLSSNVGRNPVEIVQFFNDGSLDFDNDGLPDTEFNLAFELFFGPAPGRMKYVDFDGGMVIEEYSTSTSTSFGHFAAEGVFAVGAAPYNATPEFGVNPAVMNSYSARGRQTILFDIFGNRLAQPIVRNNLGATGPDQGDTTFFFPGIDIEPNGLPNFPGTSAAAPHVAAVAALVLDAAGGPGSLSVKSLYTALQNTATDILQRNVDAPTDIQGGLGYDHFSGHGLVNALAAVQGALNGFDLEFDANDIPGDETVNDGDPANDGAQDVFTVALLGTEVVVTINGLEVGRMNLAAIESLTITGSNDDDLLIVDATNGNPIPAGGLEFNGGGSTSSGDRIQFIGGAAALARHTLSGPGEGNSEFDGHIATFSGVELVADLTAPSQREIELVSAEHSLTLSDGAAASDGTVRLASGGTVPAIDFTNATVATTLTTGSGSDFLSIDALDSLATSPIHVFLGGGDDHAAIVPQAATPLSLDGGAQSVQDLLSVNALDVAVTDTGTTLQFTGYQTVAYANFERLAVSNAGGGGGLPDISVEGVSNAEGSAGGTTDFVFTVTLSVANPTQSVFVNYFTSDGDAEDEQGDGDYFATSGTLEFLPGTTQQTVVVHVQQDLDFEGSETFFLNFANAINANLLVEQAIGVIVNDDFADVEVVYVDDSWLGTPLFADPDGNGPALSFGVDAFASFPTAVAAISAGGSILMYAGNYQGAVIDKDLAILGIESGVSINGASPAVTIASGNVSINGVTLDTASDDATLLVEAGSLKLRNATVRETNAGSQAAIRLTGGTADLGTTAEVGLNRFRVRGAGWLIDNETSSAIPAIGNTWVQGDTTLDNYAIEDRVEHALDDATRGLVTWVDKTLFVTAFTSDRIDALHNNYRRLANMAAVLGDDFDAYLKGVFDFAEPNALADWALGNDAAAGTDDDYHVVLPGDISGVKLSATNLGDATIVGPGDVAVADLEGVFQFTGADNHGWEISRLQIFDFDLAIDLSGSGDNPDARDDLRIADNHLRLARDLNFGVAPADVFQNIGIALGQGHRQTVRGNQIDIPGDSVSDGSQFAAAVGIQNRPAGPADYDDLLIENNTIHVLSAPAAQPATIIGIWDSADASASDIIIRGNSFLNDAAGNDAADNLQRAFRIGSQSGPGTTVLYENNTVEGANIAFQWQLNVNLSGHEPVELRNNDVSDVFRGIVVASQGSAVISGNVITGLGPNQGIGIDVQGGSTASIDGVASDNSISGFDKGIFVKGAATINDNAATISGNNIGIDIDGGTVSITANRIENNTTGIRITDGGSATAISNNFIVNNSNDGIRITATAGVVGPIFNNSLSGNGNRSIRNQSGDLVDASGNWWGVSTAEGVHQEAQGDVDFSPWLDAATDIDGDPSNGFQGDFTTLHVDDDSPQAAAVGLIQEGIIWALAGGTVIVHDGLYRESNATVDQPLTIVGESRTGVVIAPASTDDHVDTAFGGAYQHGFIVQSSDVTIKNLTIDGRANTSLQPGRNNFRNGIVTDRRTAVVYDRTRIEDVDVRHIYRRGIELYSSEGAGARRSIDNIIRNSGIEDVTLREAILVREGNALIENNVIEAAAIGIGGNDRGDFSNAPLLIIQGNEISGVGRGISLSGVSAGTLVGGAGKGNRIDLRPGNTDDVGIFVQYAQGQVAIAENEILAEQDDAAIWLFSNADASRAIVVARNTLTSEGATSHGVGQGVGVFLTDDGDLFGLPDGASHATMTENVITGFAIGIHLYQNGDSPAGGQAVTATIGGATPDLGNHLIDNGVGIRVYEADGAEGGGRLAVAQILNNSSSITGGRIGIDVSGGAAAISGNRVVQNGIGVRVERGGAAMLQDNDLTDNEDIGLLVQSRAIVDAGQEGVGEDFTGLGVSHGGNDFSSYTATANNDRGAIVNRTEDNIDGRQGVPPDVSARQNAFFSSNTADIEKVVYHDVDDGDLGFVDFFGLQDLALTFDQPQATEGSPITLQGSFLSDFAGPHEVTIDWGDGQAETIVLGAGVFAFNRPHTYADDDPTLTPADTYSVTVTVAEVSGPASLTKMADLTVQNATPVATIHGAPSDAPIGEPITLTGSFTDAGTLDTHTLTWQVLLDGVPFATGTGADFTFTPAAAGEYLVKFSVADDDSGQGSDSVTIQVLDTPLEAPRVAGVQIASSDWQPAFFELLEASGYAIPGGAGQWAVLPWVGLNTIQITFTEDVVVNSGSLTVSGVNLAHYGIGSFSYNASTFTATWVLSQAIGVDLVTFKLSTGVLDVDDGLALDGEWTNGTSAFPSGNEAAGGEFSFGFRVLPGDIDRSGTVDLVDLNAVRNNFGAVATSIFADPSGDGAIELGDLNAVRNNFGALALPIPPGPMTGGSPASAIDVLFAVGHDDNAPQFWSEGDDEHEPVDQNLHDDVWDVALAGLDDSRSFVKK